MLQTIKKRLLDLAIRGQIVPQMDTDGTADQLLQQISAEHRANFEAQQAKEKAEAEANGKAFKPKKYQPLTFSEIPESEIPFDIPSSWRWVRLGEIGEYRKGPFGSSLTKSMFVPQSETTIKVYEQKNAIQKDYTIGSYYITKDKFESMRSFIVKPTDIIVSCAGTIGESYKLPNDAPIGILNQALMRVRLYIDEMTPFWMLYFDYFLKRKAAEQGTGTAIKNIPPFDILKSFPIPLPPLSEQHRIVEKLESMLKEIDVIEESQKKIEELSAVIWRCCLQEAISGRLTEQLQSDGSADQLLEQIKTAHRQAFDIQQQAEKAEAEKAGKKFVEKKYKPLTFSQIPDSEIPFDIPENWKWVRLGEIGDWGSGSTPDRTNPNYYNGDVIWIKTGELNNSIVYDSEEKISREALQKGSFKINKIGDVMIAMYGATIGKLGIAGNEMVTNQACCSCSLYGNISNNYLFYYLMASKDNFIKMGSGGAQPNISRTKIISFPIPLPPLSEQLRIVSKLDRLRTSLDKS